MDLVLWCRMKQAFNIETEAITKILIGLGNPGERYARNRHNAGFMVLDSLLHESSGLWSTHPLYKGCRVAINGRPVLLMEPLTYMNHSGKAVYALLSELQREPQDLLPGSTGRRKASPREPRSDHDDHDRARCIQVLAPSSPV